jgi:ribose transport system substrate-binding protein
VTIFGSNRTARITVTAALCALLAVAGCSSKSAKKDSGTTDAKAIATSSPGIASTTWVKWDKKSCALVSATAPSGAWQAVLREQSGVRIGYATQAEGVAVVDLANASMKSDTDKVKGEYVFANYAYPDAAKVLDGARSITTRKADVVASWNLLVPSMDAVLAIYKTACIPVIQISTKAAGTVLFGPDNNEVGAKEGAGLAAWAKTKGWTAATMTILGVTVPSLGDSVNLRVSGCIAAIKKEFAAAGSSSLELAASTTAEGQTKTTDWLTANPTKKQVLTCTNADTAAFGVANAAKGANRGDQLAVAGVGGSASPGGSFVGTVDFGFKNYGDFLVPLALDLVAGKPVPETVSPALTFVAG